MPKNQARNVIIEEGKVKKGGVIGHPSRPKPDIVVQGMGSGSSISTENKEHADSQSTLGNQYSQK